MILRHVTRALLCAALVAATAALAGEGSRITSKAAAIDAAKRYLKGRCNAQTPCKFRPEHEGRQWRVWVQLTRREAANRAPHPYPGGTLVLYFDENGNLIRRLEAD